MTVSPVLIALIAEILRGPIHYERWKNWSLSIAAGHRPKAKARWFFGVVDYDFVPAGLCEGPAFRTVDPTQQKAAAMALAAKRGEISPSSLSGAAKQMYAGMSEKELRDFAKKPKKGN